MISIGINYSQMHDSSACIARDGEVLFAVAEERLSRVKHDARFPALAIRRAWILPASARTNSTMFARAGLVRAQDFCTIFAATRRAGNAWIRGPAQFHRHFLSMSHQRGGENHFPSPLRSLQSAVSFYGSS